MSGPRKSVVKNRSELASVLAKIEAGKSQAKIADIRQLLKILIALDAAGIISGRKSIFAALRRESRALAEKKRLKVTK